MRPSSQQNEYFDQLSFDLRELIDNFNKVSTTKKEKNQKMIDRAQGMEDEEALNMFPQLRMFKMENNTISLVRELFDPLVEICNDHKDKILTNSNLTYQIQKDLEIAISRLEDTKSLKEMLKDQHQNHLKLYTDCSKEIEYNRKVVSEVSNMIKNHDEQLQRTMEDQQYELLFQDLRQDLKSDIAKIRGEVKQQLTESKGEFDVIKYENTFIRQTQKHQKGLINKIDAQIGWQKYNINQLITSTEDLPVIQKQIQATDNYLHKILPIQTQFEILKNCKLLVQSKEDWNDKLDLLEYNNDKFQDLKEILEKKSPFDKNYYEFPKEMEQEIENLKLQIKNAKDNSNINSESEGRSKKFSDYSQSSDIKKEKKKKRKRQEEDSDDQSQKSKIHKKRGHRSKESQASLSSDSDESSENQNTQEQFKNKFAQKYLNPNVGKYQPFKKSQLQGLKPENEKENVQKDGSLKMQDNIDSNTNSQQNTIQKNRNLSQDNDSHDPADLEIMQQKNEYQQNQNLQRNAYKSPKELLQEQNKEQNLETSSQEKMAQRNYSTKIQQLTDIIQISGKKSLEQIKYEEQIQERLNKLYRKIKTLDAMLLIDSDNDSLDELFNNAGDSLDGDKSEDSFLKSSVTQKEFQKLHKKFLDLKKANSKMFEKIAMERQFVKDAKYDDEGNFIMEFEQQKDEKSNLFSQQLSQAQQRISQKQFVNYQQQIDQKLEQIELLKLEMKKELKRLQQQHMNSDSRYENHAEKVKSVMDKMTLINQRQTIGDCAMATIFKLLRINYALAHQDEIDKQSIFLAGFDKIQSVATDRKDHSPDQKQIPKQQNINISEFIGNIEKDTYNSSIDSVSSIDQTQNNDQIKIILGINEAANLSKNSIKGQKRMNNKLKEGVLSNQNNGNKIISFDNKCLNCYEKNKQMPNLYKAFKIACLSYSPSKVIFDQKSFERSQLVEVQGYLLYLALEQMKHLDFDYADNQLLGDGLRDQDQTSLYSVFGENKKEINLNSLDTPSLKADEINQLLDQSSSQETDRNKFKKNKLYQSNIQNCNQEPFQKPFKNCEIIKNENNLSISKQYKHRNQDENNDKIVNFAEYTNGPNISTINTTSNNVYNQSNQLLLQNSSEDSKAVKGKKNYESLKRLSRLINISNNQTTLSLANKNHGIKNVFGLDTKMISFSKSKEYAKLAQQIPAIFTIENGKKVLNQSDLINIGITQGGNTPQDQYQQTLNQIKVKKHQLKQQIEDNTANQQNFSLHKINKGFLYNQISRQFKNMTTSPSNDVFNGIQSPESIQFDYKHGSPPLLPQVNFSMPIINFQQNFTQQAIQQNKFQPIENTQKNKQNLLISTNSKNIENFQNLLTPQNEQQDKIIVSGGQSILQKIQHQRINSNQIHQINSDMKTFKSNINTNLMSPISTPHRRRIEDESIQNQNKYQNTFDDKTKSDRKVLNNVLVSRPIRLNKIDKLSQAELIVQQNLKNPENDPKKNIQLFQPYQQQDNHPKLIEFQTNKNMYGITQTGSERILPFSNHNHQFANGGNLKKFQVNSQPSEIQMRNQQKEFQNLPDLNNRKPEKINNQQIADNQVIMGETQRLSSNDDYKNQSNYQLSLLNADEDKNQKQSETLAEFNKQFGKVLPKQKGYTVDIIIQSNKQNIDK